MGPRNSPPLSFNTVKHSNRKMRAERIQRERMTLLAICAVFLALLLTLAVFIFCSLADTLNLGDGEDETGNQTPSPTPDASGIVWVDGTVQNGNVYVGELVAVNRDHPYSPSNIDKVAQDLVNISNEYKILHEVPPYSINSGLKLKNSAFLALDKMLVQYYNITGQSDLRVTTAFRTYQEQANLTTSLAKAGESDHHTGYSVRIRYVKENGDVADLSHPDHWIYQNAEKYGFIVRYPNGKESTTHIRDNYYLDCFRYVGVAHATYIKANNLSLEEYVALLQAQYAGDTHLKITGADGNNYEVYYVPANTENNANGITQFKLPKNFKYDISGDNIGGFIVTVHLSEPIANT